VAKGHSIRKVTEGIFIGRGPHISLCPKSTTFENLQWPEYLKSLLIHYEVFPSRDW